MTVAKCKYPEKIKDYFTYGTCLDKEQLFYIKTSSCFDCITIDSTKICESPIACSIVIIPVESTNCNIEIYEI